MFLGCGHPTFDYHTVDVDDPQCNMQGMECVAWRMAPLVDSHMRCRTCEDAFQEGRIAEKRLIAKKLKEDTAGGEKEYKWGTSGRAKIHNWLDRVEVTREEVKEEKVEAAPRKKYAWMTQGEGAKKV